MPTHTYSTVLYDITWQDIGNAIDSIDTVDSLTGVDAQARYDTSGGTRDDGTTYDTEAVLTMRYDYSLGDGQTALEEFAAGLADVPALPDDTATLKTEIRSRG